MGLLKQLIAVALLQLVCLFLFVIIRRIYRVKYLKVGSMSRPNKIGIFHPYCNAGGGGERVLWFAVQAIQELNPQATIQIYARKSSGKPKAILDLAKERFGVKNIDERKLEFVFLQTERLLEAETFPRLTLIGQSLGSVIVGIEALYRGGVPDIYFDTMGYAFTYPVAWTLGARIACYTHYPTISTDMLQRVYERRPAYSNDELVSSGSVMNSRIKYVYYLLFCRLYRFVGLFPELTIVNSNWTGNHINQLWNTKSIVIFPPCDSREFTKEQKVQKKRIIASLGQFRPEKDHRLQISSIAKLLKIFSEDGKESDMPKLLCFGSCRDEADEARIQELKHYAEKLGVEKYVEFHVNVPFKELKQWLGTSLLGIHTMWNEHFGIAPVEMMAAGIILIAHNSGGPKIDIIQHGETGYLADTDVGYAEVIAKVIDIYDSYGGDNSETLMKMRNSAIESVQRFSQEEFGKQLKFQLQESFP